jgi:hypothetical protein
MLSISISNTIGARPVGIDAQALAHYNRVIADGGVVPAGVSGVNAFFNAVKTIYATNDITTAISVGVDAHYLGYKLGAGSGTTLGQAAQKLYSCAGSSGDVVQTTAVNQPLLLSHNGASTDNYFYVPRVDGNNCTTPDTVASRISGDIEIISYIEVKGTDIDRTIIAKGGLSNANFAVAVHTSNIPYFVNGDLTLRNATSALPNVNTWLRVTRVSSTGDIKFWTSTDSKTTAPLSVNWTQLGTTVSGPSGSRTTTTDNIVIGKYNQYINNSFNGNIFRATVSNVIGGTPVVDFNPATYNASTSQTQWTSTTGEVWTINTGTANTGYKGVLVDRTIVQGDGVDDRMASGTLASRQFFTSYSASRIFNYVVSSEKPVYSASSASHLLYSVVSLNAWNGFNLISGNTSILLNAQTVDFNDTSSKIRINAGSDVLGSTGNQTSTDYKLMVYGGTVFGNVIFNTLIQPKSLDSNTTKTAMYNYIRSINNNAF